jgi:tetratricopeptide (TPR) repeat protein
LARALVGAFGAASLGVSLLGAFEMERGVGGGFAAGDIHRLELAEQRLRWIGRASPEVPLRIGMLKLRRGLLADAERDFDRSLALHPTPAAWLAKGYVSAKEGNFALALERYDQALALDAHHVEALYQSGYALLELGRPSDAVERLTRAAAVEPASQKVSDLLASARGASSPR